MITHLVLSFVPRGDSYASAHLTQRTTCQSDTIKVINLPMRNLRIKTLVHSSHTAWTQGLFTFCHKGGIICISEVINISPGNLDSSLCFIQPRVSHGLQASLSALNLTFAHARCVNKIQIKCQLNSPLYLERVFRYTPLQNQITEGELDFMSFHQADLCF